MKLFGGVESITPHVYALVYCLINIGCIEYSHLYRPIKLNLDCTLGALNMGISTNLLITMYINIFFVSLGLIY